MKLLASFVLFSIFLIGQPKSPESVSTKGNCSPIIKGNGNTINIKTCGMNNEQVAEWRTSFKQILEKQIDPKVLIALLDDIKSGQIRIENGVLRIESEVTEIAKQQEPRRLTDAQAQQLERSISPYRGQKIIISSYDPEGKSYAEFFVPAFDHAGWLDPNGGKPGVGQILGYSGAPPIGVQVTINDAEAKAGRVPPAAIALLNAVVSLGATIEQRPTMFVNEGVPAGTIELRVGLKPATQH